MELRRRFLKVMAAAGVLGPAGIAGLIRDALANGKAPVAPGIHKLRGEVTVNGKPAREGQLVVPGDSIATGRGGEVIYVIGQDAFLQRENSVVSFGADVVKGLMRVVTGKILSVFGKGARTIQVSTATLGIRGTACYIEDEGEGNRARTYFCLCYGSVELTPNASPQARETYSTKHHDRPLYLYNDPAMPKAMVPTGVENHSDDELDMLEALVGRWRPHDATGANRY